MADDDTRKSSKPSWRQADRRKLEIATIAEGLFARHGYDGVSIRDVAKAAGVNSALIGYHFGTKDQFYRSLFERRYRDIQQQRSTALAAAVIEPGSAVSLRAVVEAWLPPLMALADDPSSRSFVLMLARESSMAAWDRHGIYATLLNPAAAICKDALARIAPHAAAHEIAQAYVWMVGVASATLLSAPTGDAGVGTDQTRPRDAMLEPMLNFVAAGLRSCLLGDA